MREPFHDGGFSHTSLADQHRVVFRAPRKDLHHAQNLFVSADHRVELTFTRLLREVARVLFECAVTGFGLRICDALPAPQLDDGL